mmetsp:Transcript_19942/g.32722  ORF Transcript_19942/g.32722 Transcript_19942/m.32722 type:complete len:101 (+) Transcript_19942:1025-1327(+)
MLKNITPVTTQNAHIGGPRQSHMIRYAAAEPKVTAGVTNHVIIPHDPFTKETTWNLSLQSSPISFNPTSSNVIKHDFRLIISSIFFRSFLVNTDTLLHSK